MPDTDWPDDEWKDANITIVHAGSPGDVSAEVWSDMPDKKIMEYTSITGWRYVKLTRKERFMRWYRGLWMHLNPGYMRRNKNEN